MYSFISSTAPLSALNIDLRLGRHFTTSVGSALTVPASWPVGAHSH